MRFPDSSLIQYVTYVIWHENQVSVFENSINTSAALHASQSNSLIQWPRNLAIRGFGVIIYLLNLKLLHNQKKSGEALIFNIIIQLLLVLQTMPTREKLPSRRTNSPGGKRDLVWSISVEFHTQQVATSDEQYSRAD